MKGLIELPLQDTIDVFTAARMAQVTESTVRRWCDEGRIAAVKPAGRWRIYRSQFLVWINPDYKPAAPPSPRPVAAVVPPAIPVRRARREPVETLPLFPLD